MSNKDLFDKLAEQESNFLNTDFMSPVILNHPVRVRINGVILNFNIARPKRFEGWGVFRPTSFTEANLMRQPTMAERREYLTLFPAVRLVLCYQDKRLWYGVPAHSSDTRFKITGLVPIHLAEEVQAFDVVQVRFDGNTCWFEGLYEKHPPKNALYLRESMAALLDPKKLELTGLTVEEIAAYKVVYAASEEAKKNQEEERIKAALRHAGATYRSHIDRNDVYSIEYVVDGETHRSTISKNNLQVQSAGICLAGGDRAFDLQSLVGVIREGRQRHAIHRVQLDRDYGYGFH